MPNLRVTIKYITISVLLGLLPISSTLLAQTNCATPPSGLVSWWPGQTNAVDVVSTNNGIFHGGVSLAQGRVGNGFAFDGTGYIVVPDRPSLSFSNQLTIELWYMSTHPNSIYYTIIDKRVGATIANYGINNSPINGLGVFYDDPTVDDGDDTPLGSAFEVSRYSPAPSSGVFHHLAATYQQLTNNQVQLQTFVDGQLVRTRIIKGNLANTLNTSPVTIGAAVQGLGEFFKGIIDEVSIYSRALSPAEVQAIYAAGTLGKCGGVPLIVSQPHGQVGYWGLSVTLTVGASGVPPLAYLWFKDGFPITWATNASLILTNLALTDGGNYSVVVSNAVGSVSSSNAFLVVNPAGVTIGVYAGLTIDGAVGKSFGIQYSTNVNPNTTWTTLTNLTLAQPQQMWFDSGVNVSSGIEPRRFYRVVAIP